MTHPPARSTCRRSSTDGDACPHADATTSATITVARPRAAALTLLLLVSMRSASATISGPRRCRIEVDDARLRLFRDPRPEVGLVGRPVAGITPLQRPPVGAGE